MRYHRAGYFNVMKQLGNNCLFYDQEDKSYAELDILFGFNPEVVMIASYQLNRANVKYLCSHPDLTIILWCPNFSPLNKDLPNEVLKATEQERKYVDQLVAANPKLKTCYTYYSQRWANVTHTDWNNHGLKPIGIPMAADLSVFPRGKFDPNLACDVSFCGGWWTYKAQNLEKYLLPLCNTDLNVKFFGSGGYPVAQHIGYISDQNVSNLYASSKVCPAIYEPLASWGFDVSERVFKIASAGGFCISQYVESLAKDIMVNDEVVFVHNPEDFMDTVMHFVKNPEEREPYIKRSLNYAYTKGSYYNRCRDLYDSLGWKSELKILDQIIKGIAKNVS